MSHLDIKQKTEKEYLQKKDMFYIPKHKKEDKGAIRNEIIAKMKDFKGLPKKLPDSVGLSKKQIRIGRTPYQYINGESSNIELF